MLTARVAGFSAACRNGQDAPCQGACPYGLDVRGFLQKVRRGGIRGAYNILMDQLLFPETLCSICGHACRDACAYETGGAFIDLPSIEKAVIENAPKKGATKFRVPPKEEKIAVIGAGLSGVTAAYSMSSVGYSVTIFEKKDLAGGSLVGKVPEEIYAPEFASVIGAGTIELITDREIKSLSELEGFSGIIIATGAEGTDFGVRGKEHGFAQKGSVFVIGELTGAPVTSSVIYGKKAGTALDRFLKAGEIPNAENMPAPEKREFTVTRDITEITRDAAAEESQRCLMCDCTKCADVCELMKNYKKVPPRFEIDIPGTLNPVEGVRKRSATRLLMSCDDCRLCTEVCPEGIKTGEVLMQVRTAMNHDKDLPAAFHDFWMRDMDFSRSDKAEYLKKPENGYLYFTGCLLGASDPENVTESFRMLEKCLPGSGIWLTCCGIPAKWAGETEVFDEVLCGIRKVWEDCGKPVFLTACPSCKRTLREFLPEIEVRSIYEIFAEHASDLELPDLSGAEAAVFRPCSGRNDAAEKESINRLVSACSVSLGELADEGDRNGCCGYGGHIFFTNPGLYDKISQKRADSDERPYITYCANCRDVLSDKGKSTTHILKLIAGKETLGHKKPPTLSERRRNRMKLKCHFTGEREEEMSMKLVIPDDVLAAMDRSLILDTDIENVIAYCEENQKFLCTENGEMIGHKRLGIVTYWVKWKRDGDEVYVISAYNHRMRIDGE